MGEIEGAERERERCSEKGVDVNRIVLGGWGRGGRVGRVEGWKIGRAHV